MAHTHIPLSDKTCDPSKLKDRFGADLFKALSDAYEAGKCEGAASARSPSENSSELFQGIPAPSDLMSASGTLNLVTKYVDCIRMAASSVDDGWGDSIASLAETVLGMVLDSTEAVDRHLRDAEAREGRSWPTM